VTSAASRSGSKGLSNTMLTPPGRHCRARGNDLAGASRVLSDSTLSIRARQKKRGRTAKSAL
jgi:hypothetical protein